MKSKLIFNGVSSEDLGLVIQTPPTYEFPDRDMSSTHIPGRNGDLVIDNKCYKNVRRVYNLAKGFKNVEHLVPNAQEVLAWLTAPRGQYRRLEDDYDPEVYRMAMYNAAGSFTNYFDKALSINAEFICKPQRFLKSGDEPVVYNSNIAKIINPSVYDALPIITLRNIPLSMSKYIIMSIKDSNGDITSSVSLTDLPDGVATIDSETQNCYAGTTDINDKIGLNGQDFPTLGANESTIEVKRYNYESGQIAPYATIISDKQETVNSEYKPYDVLESAAEDKYYVKSYASLIESEQDSYYANAYQSFIQQQCDKGIVEDNVVIAGSYIVESFNTMLKNYSQTCNISGNIEDNYVPEWLQLSYKDADHKVIVLKAAVTGFFITSSSSSKMITRVLAGDAIGEVSVNTSTTVTYYEADSSGDKLKVTYSDLPPWLSFEITYNSNNSPVKLAFKTALNGYFWTDKTWIFGKSKWNKYNSVTVLNELTWNNTKKAFMADGSFSTSTTTQIQYRYVSTAVNYPESEEEGTPHFEVRFRSTVSDDMSIIDLYAIDDGWYNMETASEAKGVWKELSSGQLITSIKSTAEFTIFYLENPPNYADEDGFPEWLNPTPISKDSKTSVILNANSIGFKTSTAAVGTDLYRVSYTVNEDNDTFSEWNNVHADTEIVIMFKDGHTEPLVKSSDISFYICRIDKKPDTYANDRSFNDSETPPTWLDVSYVYDPDFPDNDDPNADYNTIVYKANKDAPDGYYRWDSNVAWTKKSKGEILLKTGYKDDTKFYFMAQLPSYDEYAFENQLAIRPVEDPTGSGNPIEIEVKVLVAGYYRVNSNADWKYYNVNDILINAVIGATTIVRYLEPDSEQLSGIEITITPHWWIL